MSDSVVFFHGRDNVLHVIDPDCVKHFDDISPLQEIVIAVINAGYRGVVVDEKQLANGRFLSCISTNCSTPEGQILQEITKAVEQGHSAPSVNQALAIITKRYAQVGACK
jgi:hypothetical protein